MIYRKQLRRNYVLRFKSICDELFFTMKKIMFLGAGSPADPGFDAAEIARLASNGIGVPNKTVIESCHGNFNLMKGYSQILQSSVESGYKAVGVLQGGLLFALPSIQATQAPIVPFISIPLDMTAYQAYAVPTGNAAIGTVSIERKKGGKYDNSQTLNAMRIAENILNSEDVTVRIMGDGEKKEELKAELKKFNLGSSDDSKIILNYNTKPSHNIGKNEVQLWADPNENLMSGRYFDLAESILSNAPNTLQLRGKGNLAVYAAKILSPQRPDALYSLMDAGVKKANSYENRNLIKELDLVF
jgi:hypothetical protein